MSLHMSVAHVRTWHFFEVSAVDTGLNDPHTVLVVDVSLDTDPSALDIRLCFMSILTPVNTPILMPPNMSLQMSMNMPRHVRAHGCTHFFIDVHTRACL